MLPTKTLVKLIDMRSDTSDNVDRHIKSVDDWYRATLTLMYYGHHLPSILKGNYSDIARCTKIPRWIISKDIKSLIEELKKEGYEFPKIKRKTKTIKL
tara:strand:+ start:1258 stop:1551 length:294 start_codon:yes stop_codon:yes gene_type:complete